MHDKIVFLGNLLQYMTTALYSVASGERRGRWSDISFICRFLFHKQWKIALTQSIFIHRNRETCFSLDSFKMKEKGSEKLKSKSLSNTLDPISFQQLFLFTDQWCISNFTIIVLWKLKKKKSVLCRTELKQGWTLLSLIVWTVTVPQQENDEEWMEDITYAAYLVWTCYLKGN